ncbi:hypothetical protein FACS1894202_13650 [Clostridia bacterium]|nr:hypothetical protein FACS1894202_13650 [Clostridia bacterium]
MNRTPPTKEEVFSKPISPLDDFVFSKQFESMESAPAAQSLINGVLLNAGREPLDTIDALECQKVFVGEGRKLRGCRLDVAARSKQHLANVEVQLSKLKTMGERSFFNASQMLVGATNSGATFDELPKATVISLLDFTIRESDPDFHQPFALYYEKGERESVTDRADFHFLELPKFRLIEPDINNGLHRWLYYLDKGYNAPDNELTKEVLKMDTGLRVFDERYKGNVADPLFRKEYFNVFMSEWAEHDRLKTARLDGKAEGKAEGRQEERYSMFAAMKKKKLPDDIIRDLAREQGMSAREIDEMLKTIAN